MNRKLVADKPMFTNMHHIVMKFVKYVIGTFLDKNPDTEQNGLFSTN